MLAISQEDEMKTRSLVVASRIGFMFLLLISVAAEATDLRVLSAIAMQQLMEDLAPKFERATGHKLTITIATLGPALKRIQDGETFDVVLLPQRGIESLVKGGKVVASTVTAMASTGNRRGCSQGRPQA
jgi:molybdate transport system substrate-binding protein